MSIAISLTCIAVAAVPVSAQTSSTTVPAIAPVELSDGRVSELQVLASVRAAAVLADDEAAYMATVDPQAPPDFVARERVAFQGAAAMSFSTYTVEVSSARSGDLSIGQDLAARYESQVFLPETRVTYRLAGFDAVDAIDTRWYTYVKRGTQWFVASDTDVSDLGLEGDKSPWDIGPIAQIASSRVLVLSRLGMEARAQQVLALTEQALDKFAGQFELPWAGTVVVVVPSSAGELEVLLNSTNELSDFVAFVNYDANRSADWQATAPRMYLQDDNLARRTLAYQVETIVHELVHYASAQYAGPHIPGWVHEGVADWVANGRVAYEAKPPASDGVLPSDADLGFGTPSVINTSYVESRSAMAWLSAAVRPSAPVELFQSLGGARSQPGSDGYHLDAAVRQVAGISLVDFQSAWAAS